MWVQTGAYQLSSLWWLIGGIVILVIALIALLVAGAALSRVKAATRGGSVRSGAPGTGADSQNRPESTRLLDERYAKGEIGREEYQQRQNDIKSKG